MKRTLFRAVLVLVAIAMVLGALKAGQKICWEKKLSIIPPPSLTSWDPTERFEAARQLGKQWGGTR